MAIQFARRISLGLLVCLLLSACGATAQTAAPSAGTPLRIAMIIVGSAADGSWNSAGADGLRGLREQFDAEIDYTELPTDQNWDKAVHPEWEAALRKYAEAGYPLIFAHNRRFDALVAKVAPDYPATRFVITGGTASGANYASVTLKNDEVGYTLGVLAGLMTKSDKIGMVAGEQLKPFMATTEGFRQGVVSVNPNAEIMEQVLPKTKPGLKGAPWSVDTGANAETEMLIAAGADVIFGRAAGANVGIIDVASKHKVFAIAYGKDLSNLAPDTVLASGIQVIPATMQRMTELFREDKFKGQNYLMGFAEGAVAMSKLRDDLVPATVQTQVAQAQAEFETGKRSLTIDR